MERQIIEQNLNAMLEDAKQLEIAELATKYGVSIKTLLSFLSEQSPETFNAVAIQSETAEVVETPAPSIETATIIKPVKKIDGTYEFGKAAGTRGDTLKKKTVANLYEDGDFDVFYKQYKEWIGWKEEISPKRILTPTSNHNKSELTVIAGDLHVPYHHEEALKWMINRTCKKARRIVIAGDLADMFWCSKYMKFSQHFSPVEEIKRVQAVLVGISEAYEEVVLMRGNHDDRFIKYLLRQGIKPEAMEVFKYLYGEYSMHPIYVLAHGLSNVKVVEPITKDYAEFSYLYQVGDCVISHAEKYSQQPNKIAEDVIKVLMSYHIPSNLIKPFNVLVQCHTHMAGKTWGDYGKVGIENGCLAMTPDYSGNAKLLPRRPPVLGYTELYQTNGISDLEKTNFVPYLG